MLGQLLGGALLGSLALLLAILLARKLTRRTHQQATETDGGEELAHASEHEQPSGAIRWLTTVNHRDIGVLYLLFAIVAFLWGGTDAMMMRTELATSSVSVWNTQTYNALFTQHGFTMLFLFATPAIFGFVNYFLPILIGADDMAFPRVNAIAFWLLPPSMVLIRAGLITDVVGFVVGIVEPTIANFLFSLEPPATGWTMYTPQSAQRPNQTIDLVLLGLHLSGIATTMGAINVIATVVTERGAEVGWPDLDIFSWTVLVQSGIVLFAFPLLGSALVMLLLDRNFGTTFFAVEGGGPLLWQHLFWFFGHPEVYIIVLPPMGLISLILPRFAARKLFGFKFIVYSTLAIAVLSFGVWAHHMFSTGIDPRIRASFMAVSIAIAVPSAVKVFNWITTMWNGRIRLEAPMLFCVGAIATFIVGGVTGVFLASVPIDLLVHDTYYVVGHFHLIVMGIIPFSLFAALYYWFPLFTGKMYDRRLGAAHFALTFLGVIVTFPTLLVIGWMGLPRRYASYPEQFELLQQVASMGALFIFVGQAIFLWNLVQSYRRGPSITDADVWDLEADGMLTREWEWLQRKRERNENE